MTDREKFEGWHTKAWELDEDQVAHEFSKEINGQYCYPDVILAWEAWQASRRQAIEEAALICGNAAAGLALEIEAKGKPQTMPDVLAASVAGVAVAQASKLGSAIRALANPEGEQE